VYPIAERDLERWAASELVVNIWNSKRVRFEDMDIPN
jgi:hypothetical protein